MAKKTKLLLALIVVIAAVLVGLAYLFFNQSNLITEEEAKALVTERYGGTVESVEKDNDERYFNIDLNSDGRQHEVKIDREDSSIEAIEIVSDSNANSEGTEADSTNGEDTEEPQEKDETTDSNKEDQDKNKEENKAPEKKDKQPPKPEPIPLEEAKEIASNEVGGEHVYSTWHGEGDAREYYILQLVDGDDEGALVSVNGLTGQVYKVVWLEIDDDDYSDIERLIYEVNEYSKMSPQRYIEYDEDTLDDYEEQEEEVDEMEDDDSE